MADLDDSSAFVIFIEGMRKAREAARALAHLRKEEGWLKIANNLELVEHNAVAFIQMRESLIRQQKAEAGVHH